MTGPRCSSRENCPEAQSGPAVDSTTTGGVDEGEMDGIRETKGKTGTTTAPSPGGGVAHGEKASHMKKKTHDRRCPEQGLRAGRGGENHVSFRTLPEANDF